MTTSYNEKVFLLESRLYQLANLCQLVRRMQLEEYQEVLNEIKAMLIHFKMNLFGEGNYTYVPFHPPIYLFEKETTDEIVDQMVYIFLQRIVSEFDLSTFYDKESLQILNSILDPSKQVYLYRRTFEMGHPEGVTLQNVGDIRPIEDSNVPFEPSMGLSGYNRYLHLTVSPFYFNEWDQKRKQYFIPDIKTQYIKKVEYNTSVECGICLEDHSKKEMIACNCSHEFGQVCFKSWMDTCKNSKRTISCPNCREEVTETKLFKQKGRPPKV